MKYEGSYNDFGEIANSNLCPPVCIRDESPYTSTSFIGEVGGTFGLFLGVSVFTTLFDLIKFFNYSLKCQ